MPDIDYVVADHVAVITFNRPDKLNAFTRDMARTLIAHIDQADADDNVRAVIITGTGRVFCAGADLSAGDSSFAGKPDAMAAATGADGAVNWAHESLRDFGGYITLRLFDCLKPVIVAFNGPAAGMGVTMALAADIRIASTTAKFNLPFVRRGIVPESASSWFLPRIVGIGTALEWILSGGSVSADQALAARLVRSLHAPEDLMVSAQAIAREIVEQASPVSVALARQLLWKMLGAAHPMEAHRYESWGLIDRTKGTDLREGVASFLEKRAPQFQDRVSADLPERFPWWETPRF